MAINKENLVKNFFTIFLVFLLLLSALFLIQAGAEGHFRSIESLREYLASYGKMGPFVLTMIQALQVIIPVLPGFLGCIAGSILFGAKSSFWINYIGICTGSIIAYWLARWFGKGLVQKMIPPEKYGKYENWVNQSKSYTLVLSLAVLLPMAPDDFLCYFSGLTSMSAKKYIMIILLAKPWDILLYSLFFSYLI